MKTKIKITWLTIVAVVSALGCYFSIRSIVVSNTEIGALTNSEGLTAGEYLKKYANDPWIFGFTYLNSKRMHKGEGILDLTIRLGDGEKPAGLSPDDPVTRSIRSLTDRLDQAGFPTEIMPAEPGQYRLRITHTVDPEYVKRIICENVEIGIWKMLTSDLYSESDTDIFEIISDRLQKSGNGSLTWGYAAKQDTAGIIELFSEHFQPYLPKHTCFKWGSRSYNEKYLDLYCLHSSNRSGGPLMTVGDYARNVEIENVEDYTYIEGYHKYWVVNIEMDPEGARIWSRITRENIRRSIAVTLNDSVLIAATINDEISSGKIQLREFTYEDAVAVRSTILAGNLELPVQIVNEEYAPLILNEKTAKTGFHFSIIAFFVFFVLILISMVMIVLEIVKRYTVKRPDPVTIPEAGQPGLQNVNK